MENEILQRLDESFGPSLKAMEQRKKQQAAQPQEQPMPQAPVDFYQEKLNKMTEYNKRPHLNGSSQKAGIDIKMAMKRIKPLYDKAKDDSARLAKVGDMEGSRIAKEQYMRDVFYPTIEAIVRMNSPEEIMYATYALNDADKYVLVDGGATDGFTSAFVNSLYQSDMGTVVPTSDAVVERAVENIKSLVYEDQIRAAVGAANKIKTMIDLGKNTASPEDYEIIQSVALRGQ